MRFVHPLKIALLVENLSQRELARRADYTEETLSRVLHGRHKPSPEMRARIAEVLGRPVRELFPSEGDPK